MELMVKVTKSEMDMVVKKVDGSDLKIKQLAFSVRTMNTLLDKVAWTVTDETYHREINEMIANVTDIIHIYNTEMNDYFDALAFLTLGRLSPLIIDIPRVRKLFDEVKKEAERFSLKPLYDHPSLMFSSTTSTLMVNGKLHAIVHLPLVGGEKMHLLHYIHTPLYMPPNITYTFTMKEDVLAVNEAETIMKIFTMDDLEDCQKIGQEFHCPHSNILNKDLNNNCLYSLFKGYKNKIRELCNPVVSQAVASVTQVDKVTFRIIAPTLMPLDITCTNKTRIKRQLEGVKLVKVEPGCQAVAGQFFLRNDVSINVQADIIEYPVKLVHEDLLGKPFMMENNLTAHNIVSYIDNISRSLDMIGTPVASLRHQIQMHRLVHNNRKTIGWLERIERAIYMVLFGLLALLGLYILFRLSPMIMDGCQQTSRRSSVPSAANRPRLPSLPKREVFSMSPMPNVSPTTSRRNEHRRSAELRRSTDSNQEPIYVALK